jgi:hypothetical protein
MIFKTNVVKNGPYLFNSNWVIIDEIKKAVYNNISSKTCFLVVEPLSQTSVDEKGLSFFKNNGVEDFQLVIDDGYELCIDYDHYIEQDIGKKFYLNWIDITLEDESHIYVLFDRDGYLLNNNGKTIETIRCY